MLELINGGETFEQREWIFKTFVGQVTLAVALKGAGMKGAESCDPRAAKLFFDEMRLHEEEARRRKMSSGPVRSTRQQEWIRQSLEGFKSGAAKPGERTEADEHSPTAVGTTPLESPKTEEFPS
jgi:hypothetical protein